VLSEEVATGVALLPAHGTPLNATEPFRPGCASCSRPGRRTSARAWTAWPRWCSRRCGPACFAGEVFVFRPKRADRVRILVYDGTGLVLYSKRLEAGRFTWPSPAEGVVRLSAAQLATLLEGLPWHRLQPRPVRRPSTAW
jgi:IS66 Orf2 like protein